MPVAQQSRRSMTSMLELASSFGSHCLTAVQDHGSLLLSMFLAGLVGSATHCVGMCGPFVAAQSIELAGRQNIAEATVWKRLTGSALMPYQLGRLTTYMGLGALASLPVSLGSRWPSLSLMPSLLLWLAAGIFFVQGLTRLGALRTARSGTISIANASWSQPWPVAVVRDFTRQLFRQPVGWHGYLLGILLGFLPCGLLYGALIVAAATASPLTAALAMLAFTVGTFPLSWAVGYGSRFATVRFRSKTRIPLALLMIFNAILLAALGLQAVRI